MIYGGYSSVRQGFVMNLQPSEAEVGLDDPVSIVKRIAEEWAPTSRNMTFEVKITY